MILSNVDQISLFNLDPAGKCNETIDGPVPFSMSPDKPYTDVVPPFCLEEGKRYQIKLTFDQFDPAKSDPKANILIDSVWYFVTSLFWG